MLLITDTVIFGQFTHLDMKMISLNAKSFKFVSKVALQ